MREVDYTLKTLAKNLLGQERSEVPSTGKGDGGGGLRVGGGGGMAGWCLFRVKGLFRVV